MGLFDRFADWATTVVSRAPFFSLCAALVIGWCIGLPFAGPKNQLYHLLLNSPTTAITFLLVALLENAQARFEKSTNKKLNAIADYLADISDDPDHAAELRKAVGIEKEMAA